MGGGLGAALMRRWAVGGRAPWERPACTGKGRGGSPGIGMRWEKCLFHQGLKDGWAPPGQRLKGRSSVIFPRASGVSRQQQLLLRQRRKSLDFKRPRIFLLRGKGISSTSGRDLNLTNCLISDSHASEGCFIALPPSFITLFPICILRDRTKMIF